MYMTFPIVTNKGKHTIRSKHRKFTMRCWYFHNLIVMRIDGC